MKKQTPKPRKGASQGGKARAGANATSGRRYELAGLGLLAVGLISLCGLCGWNVGWVGDYFAKILHYLLGVGAFPGALAVLYLGWQAIARHQRPRFTPRTVGVVAACAFALALCHHFLIPEGAEILPTSLPEGGGLVGGGLLFLLRGFLGVTGGLIVALLGLVGSLVLATGRSLSPGLLATESTAKKGAALAGHAVSATADKAAALGERASEQAMSYLEARREARDKRRSFYNQEEDTSFSELPLPEQMALAAAGGGSATIAKESAPVVGLEPALPPLHFKDGAETEDAPGQEEAAQWPIPQPPPAGGGAPEGRRGSWRQAAASYDWSPSPETSPAAGAAPPPFAEGADGVSADAKVEPEAPASAWSWGMATSDLTAEAEADDAPTATTTPENASEAEEATSYASVSEQNAAANLALMSAELAELADYGVPEEVDVTDAIATAPLAAVATAGVAPTLAAATAAQAAEAATGLAARTTAAATAAPSPSTMAVTAPSAIPAAGVTAAPSGIPTASSSAPAASPAYSTLTAPNSIRAHFPDEDAPERPPERPAPPPPPPYRLPQVTEILDPPVKKANDRLEREITEKAQVLAKTLHDFKVQARIINACHGPAVTRYELEPAPGVKVSKITGLADDLALALAVSSVRIEPIPGKAALGIEVPNKELEGVRLREVLENPNFAKAKSKLTVGLGMDIGGQAIFADLGKMPHLLVAGATGSGKSVCINTLITSILFKAGPDEVKFILIDPKMVELSNYNGIPHLMVPVVTEAKKASAVLGWAVQEMEKRYAKFAEQNVRNMATYNAHFPEDKMPAIVIIIDELADLMMVAPHDVEDAICRLAQKARAAGIHMVLATQRPSVNVITGLIKANIPSRIAFAVSSQIDSRTILDTGGAEKLLGKGDMLFAPIGSPKPTRVQGAFVSDEEVERLLDFIRAQGQEAEPDEEIVAYTENALREDEEEESGTGRGNKPKVDKLLSEAVDCVLSSGIASTSGVQRRLAVGYTRAARLIDTMAELGIVGPAHGSKPREILMNAEEAYEVLREATQVA